ncbi:MAG: DNA N-6-adenine-methyltransferase [Cyanobacteriota bacterium]
MYTSYTTNSLCLSDGLSQPWFGRVWCNPPYGRRVEDWLLKANAQYQSWEVEAAIMLLNRTGAAWYKKLKKEASAICEAEKRIAFLDATGKKQKSPRYYNDFLYLGKDVELFENVFQRLGEVAKKIHSDENFKGAKG